MATAQQDSLPIQSTPITNETRTVTTKRHSLSPPTRIITSPSPTSITKERLKRKLQTKKQDLKEVEELSKSKNPNRQPLYDGKYITLLELCTFKMILIFQNDTDNGTNTDTETQNDAKYL